MMDKQIIKETFNFIGQHQWHLTEFQAAFLTSLKKYYTKNKTLTEKQSNVLLEIARTIDQAEKAKILVEPNNQ